MDLYHYLCKVFSQKTRTQATGNTELNVKPQPFYFYLNRCFVSTCYLYEYHFIREAKTWEEAQKYCRENYADLASVFDMADMARLHESKEYEGKAWIGLFSNPGKENRMWHWSLPGVNYTKHETRWGSSEPDDQNQNENCVKTRGNWTHARCDQMMPFICYDAVKLILITEEILLLLSFYL
uniref:C-type lectin domain-containing protein n=1 Tax=Haplochromis burtoni TaxID=8153 RepID=A0A3Q2VUR2_HAPBU